MSFYNNICKCFTSNNSNRPSLNVTDIFKDFNQRLADEHERIMNLRNGYIVHAGSEFDKCSVIGTLETSGNMLIGMEVTCQLSRTVNMHKITVKLDKAFAKIRDYVGSLAYDEINRILIGPHRNDFYRLIETEDSSSDGFKRFDFEKV